MTHTPEKWHVGYGQECDIDAGDDGCTIGYPTGRDEFNGTVFMVTGEDQVEIIAEHIRDEKTAHQIKAIPDMLEALDNVYGGCWIDRDSYGPFVQKKITMEEYEAMGIAIKKARGME